MPVENVASAEPLSARTTDAVLSPWWRRASLITMALGFAVLILLTFKVYHEAPPIPEKVMSTDGAVVFTADDVRAGQEVFLKYGLMDNGSIWGHGALLGPDFSAAYLHSLALHSANHIAQQRHASVLDRLTPAQRAGIEAEVRTELKRNRFDPQTATLTVEPAFADWFKQQPGAWSDYFSSPVGNGGLSVKTISDPADLRQLSAFVAWTAWASVVTRPGTAHSYTNNFPFDPVAGNTPTADAVS